MGPQKLGHGWGGPPRESKICSKTQSGNEGNFVKISGKSIQAARTVSAKVLRQEWVSWRQPEFAFSSSANFGPQDYKKFWAGLQGCTLYFYNSNRDSQVRMGRRAGELIS